MSSVLVLLAALGCSDALGLAEMISNYAKVTTNSGVIPRNETNRYPINATMPPPATNETDYEDFDDLESATEGSPSGRAPVDTATALKFVNGLVSLLSLMYTFGGRGKRPEWEGRYNPDSATKKFKYQGDQEQQPIGNFPPYNPFGATTAESYSQNNGQTSYDSDLQQFKPSMSDYMTQNEDVQPYGSDQGWESHDYAAYKPEKVPPASGEVRHPWQDYPIVHGPPEAKPINYHDFQIPEHLDEHDEDRVNKKPYSYYFLGRKLWYIPLIFSVYYIIYIGALVLKSVARHKIQFPDKLWDLHDDHYKHRRRYRRIDQATEEYENALSSAQNKFM